MSPEETHQTYEYGLSLRVQATCCWHCVLMDFFWSQRDAMPSRQKALHRGSFLHGTQIHRQPGPAVPRFPIGSLGMSWDVLGCSLLVPQKMALSRNWVPKRKRSSSLYRAIYGLYTARLFQITLFYWFLYPFHRWPSNGEPWHWAPLARCQMRACQQLSLSCGTLWNWVEPLGYLPGPTHGVAFGVRHGTLIETMELWNHGTLLL